MSYIPAAIASNITYACADNACGLVLKKNRALQVSLWGESTNPNSVRPLSLLTPFGYRQLPSSHFQLPHSSKLVGQ
ncbi:MAG TPA: hypothetical protein VGS08_02855 [Candidatus Saccharimonadales bacterium]|nr:hypothetical protein [Candidatus Saccharimonadales bacterium]